MRELLLMRFLARDESSARVWQRYLGEFGCNEIFEFLRRLEYVYDESAVGSFRLELTRRLGDVRPAGGLPVLRLDDVLSKPASAFGNSVGPWIPEKALLALSEVEFLMAVEYTLSSFPHTAWNEESDAINRVFANLGVPYRYEFVPDALLGPEDFTNLPDPDEDPGVYENLGPSGRYEFRRVLDAEIEDRVIKPALRALADDRLATAATSYQDGLTNVLRLSDKTLKNAVLDFARAVLAAMGALAKATGVEAERATPSVVFKSLANANVFPVEARNVMLAAASFRNIIEHQDDEPTATKRETAEAAMGAASVAITYLATFFPPVPVESNAFQHVGPAAPADDDIPF